MGAGDGMARGCRPCDMAAAIGLAQVICSEEGMKCEAVRKVGEAGYTSEDEVLRALEEFVREAPNHKKLEARTILCSAFPDHGECEGLPREEE